MIRVVKSSLLCCGFFSRNKIIVLSNSFNLEKVNCRSISSGICQIIGRCGSLTLPYFPLLAQQYQLAVLFLLPAIAGSIYFLLPTVPREDIFGNRIIYENVSETNLLLKNQSIFKKKDSKEENAEVMKNENSVLIS